MGIDRGLDFLNKRSHMNRNVEINMKSSKEAQALLVSYKDQLIRSDIIE